jgi:hypothetical protein
MSTETLSQFARESLRPLADLMAGSQGLLATCRAIKQSAIGKQLHTALGTTAANLWRAAEWTDADYAAISGVDQVIDGTADAGQVPYTVRSLIQSLRVIAALNAMLEANPAIEVLFAAYATNPRFQLRSAAGV